MPRRLGRRRFLQVSAGAAVAAVAYGTLGIPAVRPRPKPSGPRRVLTKEFHLGPSELAKGSHSGLTVSGGGLRLARGRGAGHYLSPIFKSDIPFHYVGLFWSGSNPDGNSIGFWVRTSPDGRSWSPWQTVQVEMAPGPLAEYQTYGALIWADRAKCVQALGELRGASKKAAVSRLGLTLLNPYDGPIVETAVDLSHGGFADTASAAEADLHPETGAAAAAASAKPVTFKREDWGADESLRFSGSKEIWPRCYVPTKKLVVHHTVTGNGYATVADAKATVRAIYAYHARSLGWGDIGYNSLVDKFGNSYEGRRGRDGPGYDGPGGREILSEDVVAGHAYSHNHGSSGIALLGTFESVPPSSTALSRLRQVLAWECSRHGINPQASTDFLKASDSWNRGLANICGHRDTQSTACPGNALYALLPGLRNDIASRLANSSAPTVSITSAPPQQTHTVNKVSYAWRGNGGSGAREYSYYLEGWSLDDDMLVVYKSGFNRAREPVWGSWTTDTQAAYTLHQSGHYTFHVRARDSVGRVSVYQDNRTLACYPSWSGWENLGGILNSGPAVSSWRPGRLDVFALGTDDKLRHKWYVRGKGWLPRGLWENLGAPPGDTLSGDPGVVSWGKGRIDVFARASSDNALWHRWYVRGQGWSDWEKLGGTLNSGPAVSSWKPGRLDVFALGTDDKLRHKWYVRGKGWLPKGLWENLGAPSGDALSGDPGVVSWGDGRIDVFARASSDNALWHRWYAQGQGWSGWEELGGTLNSGPDVSSWAGGRLDVFALGTDDELRHKWYVRGKGWSQGLWENLGAPSEDTLSGDPGVVSWGDGRIDVFARASSDNALWHKWYR
jgi:hypothetical protein